jgi:hypothetical protein
MRTLRPQQFTATLRGKSPQEPSGYKNVGVAYDFVQHVQLITGGRVPGQYINEREPCSYYWHSPIQGGGGETLAEILCSWLANYEWVSPFPTSQVPTGTNVLGDQWDAICPDALPSGSNPQPVYPASISNWATAYQYMVNAIGTYCQPCVMPSLPELLGFYDYEGCSGSGAELTMLNCAQYESC